MAQKRKQNQGLAGARINKPGPGGVDWARVRADHNTGRFTDEELAALHGLRRQSIGRRRTRDNATDPTLWAHDISHDVQRVTQALLTQTGLAETVAMGGSASSVVTAALASRDVILRHRGDLSRARDVAMGLLEQLDATTTRGPALDALFALATEDLDPQQKAAMREEFKGFMRLHSRTASMHKLADSLAKLQNGERKAFGLDGDGKGAEQGKALSDVDRAARLTAILDKARQAKQAQQVPPAPGQAPIPAGQAQPTPPLH